jgi:predicted PurR-regulated permease PerM
MTKEQFLSLFLISLLAFIISQIFHIFAPFAQALFWSAILAFAFFPLHDKLRKLLKWREGLTAILSTLLVFLIVLPPLVILIVNITTQAIELYQLATNYVRGGHLEKLIEHIRNISYIHKIETHVFEWEPLKQNITEWLLTSTRNIGNLAAVKVGIITKNLIYILLNLVLMMVLTFVFLKDGEKMYNYIYQIAPIDEKNKASVFSQITGTFTAVIRGQVLTALTQAVLAGTIFWILQLPLPILFGMLTFLTSMVPVFGAVMIWGGLVIYLFLLNAYVKACILLFFGIFVISLIDNIMKPAIIGERTKLPYFLLFFGILGGLKFYGIMGIFLAPLVLSLFFSLVKIYRQKYI